MHNESRKLKIESYNVSTRAERVHVFSHRLYRTDASLRVFIIEIAVFFVQEHPRNSQELNENNPTVYMLSAYN